MEKKDSQTTLPDSINVNLNNKKNGAEIIKDLLIPISIVVTIISVGISSIISLRNYNQKVLAEKLLWENRNIDMQLKLTSQFIDLIALVHGRKGTHVSEKAIEKIFDSKLLTEEELKSPRLINNKLEDVANINIFPGAGEQNGAMIALTNLALEHEILLDPTIETLKNITTTNSALQTHCIVRLINKKMNDTIIPYNLDYRQEYNKTKRQSSN